MPGVTTEYRPAGRRAAEIAADVEAAAAAGRAPAGTLLPPVRTLAGELGVAPGTVAAAYRLLAERGVVEGHRRAGTRIRHRPAPLGRRAPSPPPGTRDLWRGNPDPALLPDLRAALAATGPERRLYGRAAVLPELAELAAAAFAADGVALPAVTVTGGALDAIERTLQAHLHPGMRVAVEDPGYAGVLDLLDALGLVAEPVAVDADGMLPDGLRTALDRRSRAVVLTPRAQNPTGAALSERRAEDLRELVAGRGVVVIEDDHAGVVAGAVPVSVAGTAGGPGVVVRSASKALGPDLRLAVVAGDPETVSAIEGRQAVGQGWVSHLLQEVVVTLLRDPAMPARLDAAASAYRRRRDALVTALGDRGVAATAVSGLNVWVRVPEEASVVAGMAARGWAVAGGARYRIASPPGVRVTTATLDPSEADEVADALVASTGSPGRTRSG